MVSEHDLLWMQENPEYESYLRLRRQLGEQSNGDLSMAEWCKTWPFQQKIHIMKMIAKVRSLQANRDLSWAHYVLNVPDSNRVFKQRAEWENQPLFVKAAIIKPDVPGKAPAAPAGLGGINGSGLYPGHTPVPESRDRPKGIVDNW